MNRCFSQVNIKPLHRVRLTWWGPGFEAPSLLLACWQLHVFCSLKMEGRNPFLRLAAVDFLEKSFTVFSLSITYQMSSRCIKCPLCRKWHPDRWILFCYSSSTKIAVNKNSYWSLAIPLCHVTGNNPKKKDLFSEEIIESFSKTHYVRK